MNSWCCLARERVMLWADESQRTSCPRELPPPFDICNQLHSWLGSILKLCNQQVEDILLELSLDSAPSSFTQVWQLPKTDNSNSSVQNAVKSAELYHEQVLPHHFLFLDNNGDELAEHWWPLEDTRCKRLTDPPCHFNLLVKPSFSPLRVFIWFSREDVFLVAERHKV